MRRAALGKALGSRRLERAFQIWVGFGFGGRAHIQRDRKIGLLNGHPFTEQENVLQVAAAGVLLRAGFGGVVAGVIRTLMLMGADTGFLLVAGVRGHGYRRQRKRDQ